MGIKLSRSPAGNFPQPPTPKLFRNIAVTFVLVTIAVIAVALWTSSVNAKVTVKVKKEPVSVDTVLDIASMPASGQIKGRVVSGTFAESKEFAVEVVSSTAAVAQTPTQISGTVRIINHYSKPQPLVVKTRLLTADGRLYRITKSVNVPVSGTVEVEAISDEVGDQYAMPAGTRLTIPGLWEGVQPLIYAEALSDFKRPGSGGPAKIVTADALAKAHEELYAAALEKAKQTLTVEAGANAGWESIFLINNSQKQSNTAVGQSADKLLAQVKVTVTAVFFPKEDVIAFIRSKLGEKIPEGYILSDLDFSKVSFKLESADLSKGVAHLAVSAEADSQLTADSPALRKDLIVGLPSDEVIRKWSALNGVEQVDVELKPNWVHRLPSMKDKITVVIN
ncbi:MAG: hypothetical protein PHC53_05030 [Patescibacteria group bacterium]|nr:hypothetical protein [Patescibacteria group bacterium]